jgi:hypothetical protein
MMKVTSAGLSRDRLLHLAAEAWAVGDVWRAQNWCADAWSAMPFSPPETASQGGLRSSGSEEGAG